MNQCKRGPNVRIIKDDEVVVFDEEGIMNDTEMKRKTFQNVASDERIKTIWGLVEGVVDGSVQGNKCGSIENLTDIMPQR